MDQVSGLPFKLVYSHWWTSKNYDGVVYKTPIANGNHSAVIEKIKKLADDNTFVDPYHANKNMFRTSEFDELFQKKIDSTLDNGFYYRHSNFIGYVNKNVNNEHDLLAVSEDDVDLNSNVKYYYPIELELNGLRLLTDKTKIQVNNTTYDYYLIDSWSEKLINLFKSGKVKIVVSNIVDPSGPIEYIKAFEDSINQIGIDGKNLIWIQGNIPNYYFDVNKTHKSIMLSSILSLIQANENIKKFPCETGLTKEVRVYSDIVRESDLNKNIIRDKKFISFNRSIYREHRLGLAYLALKYNLLEEGIWSFLNHPNPENICESLKKLLPYETQDHLFYYARNIEKMIPYEVDTHSLTADEKYSFQNIDVNNKEYYNSTYINIVTETLYGDDLDTFWSEKTWRPILNLQPFIYMGPYKSLEKLHRYGFKTFHPFIDESYDQILDPVERFKLIEKEIVKFKNMDIIEIHDWYYSITDLLIHNQNLIKNYSNYNPLEELWNL